MSSLDADIIVVGAGPAGLCVAGELSRRGVEVLLLEARPDASPGSRAIGIHPPTLAALQESGVTDRLLEHAVRVRNGRAVIHGRTVGDVRFDRLQTRFPFVATVPQARTEQALAAVAPAALRGEQVRGIREDGASVRVATAERDLRARGVIVASGARGRGLVNVPLRTRAFRDRYLMADIAEGGGEPESTALVTLDQTGVLESFPLPDGGRRLVGWDRSTRTASSPTDDTARLRLAVEERSGNAQAAERITQATSFGIRTVLSERMWLHRVWIIGDAAHEVSPIGGQGMNLGLLDAATLAPVVAAWLRDGTGEAALHHWEQSRMASARTAGRLAALNTALGRPRAKLAHVLSAAAVQLALSGPLASVAARAYAMGLDSAAGR